MKTNYDKYPYVAISDNAQEGDIGSAIFERINSIVADRECLVCIECYPGVFEADIRHAISEYFPAALCTNTAEFFKTPAAIDELVSRDLTTDPVFGVLTHLELKDLFGKLPAQTPRAGLHFVVGAGAAILYPQSDLLIYANLSRWEIQQRQRSGEIGNLAMDNSQASPASKYKRAFFLDWRVADKLKKQLLPRIDFLLDANDREHLKMISGRAYRDALAATVKRPFRLVPFFDPGPWGGQWMRQVCGLPSGPPNYAWCFDCVLEENSLLLGFSDLRVEVPAIDLVFLHPRELLGDAVHARFGTEFPIRFDFLDTMEGGNLSLQVHPLTEYMQERFGLPYTQDESYYMLDAGADACVYLGLREDIDPGAMIRELQDAQALGIPFQPEKHVNLFPAQKHDHFLIPAGTIHCSGRNSMVLEISATPYIFTFKLWDWDRLGMDGRPRPIHLDHGIANIQWDRKTEWVQRELVNCVQTVAEGEGWREERTGLHEREFIETRRHWFTGPVSHDTQGGVNVLNLVSGDEVTVDSPGNQFEPMNIHYAETFIVPAAVGEYRIMPVSLNSQPSATLKAFVRTKA
jgi:mannose-6-phosphate isomerase class I